jgi:hypothetical protein
MEFILKPSDIRALERMFGVPAKLVGATYRFEIAPQDPGRKLALEIYPGIRIGRRRGTLISVYTPSSHLQLHFCSGYVMSDVLGEVTFVGEHQGKVSGLIIEKEGGCSLFANVDRALVSGDFTQLGPEVMLSGVALSLTDSILDSATEKPRRARGRRLKARKKSGVR